MARQKPAADQLQADDAEIERDLVELLVGGVAADAEQRDALRRQHPRQAVEIAAQHAAAGVAQALALQVVLGRLVDQRRVEDDEIEVPLVDALEQVGLDEARLQAVARGVGARDGERRFGNVGRRHVRRPAMGDEQRDGAAAGADLQHLRPRPQR